MSSDVDICNLALSHIGDSATVSSIDPPEGSAQAEHCQRYYPIARDALLDSHSWSFTNKRVILAELTNTISQWQYAYAAPADMLSIFAILPYDGVDDYNTNVIHNSYCFFTETAFGYAPQPYSLEVDSTGASVIYTNQPTATCRYSSTQSDTTKFSPLFTMALSWYLASLLAGVIIKGETGAQMALRCMQSAEMWKSKAIESDGGNRKTDIKHSVSWMAGR